MVLLHGIIKKNRIAPKVDLNTARDRMRNLEERLRQRLSQAKSKVHQ